MGLDITTYRNLRQNNSPELDESGDDPDCRYLHVSKDIYDFSNGFGQGQPSGLIPDTYYDFDDSMGFRAGSYSGYGEWRKELAKMAGVGGVKDLWDKPPPNYPFIELINFADNEGVIGPILSAKLAKDFANFRERAKDYPDGHAPWFFELYCEWQSAFEMAADNGAVEFH